MPSAVNTWAPAGRGPTFTHSSERQELKEAHQEVWKCWHSSKHELCPSHDPPRLFGVLLKHNRQLDGTAYPYSLIHALPLFTTYFKQSCGVSRNILHTWAAFIYLLWSISCRANVASITQHCSLSPEFIARVCLCAAQHETRPAILIRHQGWGGMKIGLFTGCQKLGK